ncbi:hypothetical protein G6F22_020256 [Rhizopus arrhizus]|nr:hypothetical protein G6F22_020256 [Rhizopus arrhizus]
MRGPDRPAPPPAPHPPATAPPFPVRRFPAARWATPAAAPLAAAPRAGAAARRPAAATAHGSALPRSRTALRCRGTSAGCPTPLDRPGRCGTSTTIARAAHPRGKRWRWHRRPPGVAPLR